MNKQRYRIIFNKKRGQLMAVAENVTADGKSGAESGGKSTGKSGDDSTGDPASHACLPGAVARSLITAMRPLAFSFLAALGMVAIVPLDADAQVVAYRNAPTMQQPTVLSAGNGIPLVNIQTPSAAGVSHNTYSQFDVQAQGVILNNARTNTQSQLAGWIQGNPWLAAGTARVILNEVVSSNSSLLSGYVEVAGNSAQLVIANPAGITCSGCGFLNASRATLTTGVPVISAGQLDGYRVEGGNITVQGAGMDARGATQTDLIARAVQVNAGLWANDLNIVTGVNQVNAGTMSAAPSVPGSSAPAFALDVAALGGMYAGKITLLGTETGVGVRNAGVIGASAGDVVVTMDGRLTNGGQIVAAHDTRIDATAGVRNAGTIYSQGDTQIDTHGDIDTQGGLIAAAGDLRLTANGATSRISGDGDAMLAAGLAADGHLDAVGRLSAGATAQVSLHGQNLAGDQLALDAARLDLVGSQTTATDITLSATRGDLDATHATLNARGTLSANAAQRLVYDAARSDAQTLQLNAHDLSNVGGELVQTGEGDLAISLAGGLDNTQGRLATNSQTLRLAAQTLTNTDGAIIHVGVGRLVVAADTLSGSGGRLDSNGQLDLDAHTVVLDHATTLAAAIALQATSLSNRAGQTVQTGLGPTTLNIAGDFDNRGGALISQGEGSVSAGALDNRAGQLLAAGSANLTVSSGGLLNNTAGRIGAGGQLHLTAGSLTNRQGELSAGSALHGEVAGAVDNTLGAVLANTDLHLHSQGLDNTQGSIGSILGEIVAEAGSGQLNNAAGRIEAGQGVVVSASGLNNVGGLVVGQSLAVDTHTQTLDNSAGVLAADEVLAIQSGALRNDGGLLQAGGSLAIDTHGQALSNTPAGAGQGIRGQGSVSLTTGDIGNRNGGFIGAGGSLRVAAGNIDNAAGYLVSEDALLIDQANRIDNTGGQIQALKAIDGTVATLIKNTTGLIRAGESVKLTASQIENRTTLGADQGIEGSTVTLSAAQLDNTQGALRANTTLSVLGSTSLDNTGGLISSAGALALLDAATAHSNTARTLAVVNDGGLIIADQQLALDAARLSGSGQVLSGGDLTVKLRDATAHTGQIAANQNATLEVAGVLSNIGRLQAGGTLTVQAGSIDNAASGEIVGASVHLQATAHTLTNRGLIDGADTFLDSATVGNLGTGRIYGDHVAISATTLTNAAESLAGTSSAPVIAARDRLDLGAQTLTNAEHGLLFSAGDLAIGGALDADHRATGQATTLHNASASIEALGDLALGAHQISNTNEHLVTAVVAIGSQAITEYQGNGAATRYLAGTPGVYTYKDESQHLHTPEGNYSRWTAYRYTRSTTETQVIGTDPGQLLAGGNLYLTTDHLLNNDSQIIAGGTLGGSIGTLINQETPGECSLTDTGTATSYWRHHRSGKDNTGSSVAAYNPPSTIQTIALGTTTYRAGTAPTTTGTAPDALNVGNLATSARAPPPLAPVTPPSPPPTASSASSKSPPWPPPAPAARPSSCAASPPISPSPPTASTTPAPAPTT